MHYNKGKKQPQQYAPAQGLQLEVDDDIEEQLPQSHFVDQYDIENFTQEDGSGNTDSYAHGQNMVMLDNVDE